MTETAINLRYLLKFGTPQLFESFVRYSLRLDKRLHDLIGSNIAGRGGTVLPIEDRMLAGIEKSFKVAGVAFNAVDASDRSDWTLRGVYGRFEALGLADLYAPSFGVQSHYVHGNWHDLYAYQLSVHDEGFLPDLRFGQVRPQALLAGVTVLGDAGVRYLRHVADASDDRDVLEGRIAFCVAKSDRLTELHEEFLSRT